MTEHEDLFEKFRRLYTDEELVEKFVFPVDMTVEERERSDQQIWEYRKRRLQEMTPEERIYSGLLRIKYQLKAYTDSDLFDAEKNTATWLHEYMKVVDKNQKELAEDIVIHTTRLSRILNGKERMSLAIAYRLEEHSGNLIPAVLWWRLVQKEVEQEIKTDEEVKAKEKQKVKNRAFRSAS